MVYILELLRYLLPSLVMLLLVYWLLQSFLKQQENRNKAKEKQSILGTTLPVRLQAYERLILLLERLKPSSLIMRSNTPGLSATQLQTLLLQNIRDEFEHNLSQQLYVTSAVWEKVRNAREETIKLIHAAAAKLPADAVSAELAQHVLLAELDLSYNAVNIALESLKEEARANFF